LQERICFTPIFYTRGANHPYTEGCIQVVNNMMKALSLRGIKSVNFNYKYSSISPTNHQTSYQQKVEQKIPLFTREEVFHGERRSIVAYASLMETLTATRLLMAEKSLRIDQQSNRRTCVVNIVNCFRYPRVIAKTFLRGSIVLHFYMRREIAGSLVNIAIDKADKIVTSSRTVAHYIEKTYNVKKRKIETLYPPVDMDLYRPINKVRAKEKLGYSEEDRIILYMGNLRRTRFPEEIVLQTLSELIKENRKIQLLIFAPTNSENISRYQEIGARIKKLNLTNRVKIEVKDLSENEKSLAYGGSDIFLFPSIDHATAIEPPLTVLEAMSSGLPVISNNVSSICEMINDGLNGYIVDLNTQESSQLAGKVSSLLMDEEAFTKLSNNSRSSIADKVSFASSCQGLVQIFNDLCRSKA